MCKVDVLGLKTLSQMKLCLDLIGKDLSFIDDEDYSDSKVYEHLRNGNTTNVFQMYKYTPTAMIKDFEVKDIDGLCDVNAGNRPGPLAKDKKTSKSMVDLYKERIKLGSPILLDDRIDHILKSTYGNLWYQEQLIQISMVMCGYSLGGADARVRKVITKKNMNKVAELKNEFIYGKQSLKDKNGIVTGMSEKDSKYCIGAIRNGFSEEFAIKIFKYFEDFAKYSFNRSHSLCYATVAYKTAFLDLYYPVEWAISCLTLDSDDNNAKEKNIATFTHCKKNGIKILIPDINDSERNFTVGYDNKGNKAIRFGFVGIKNCGETVCRAIIYMRNKDGNFKDLADFLDRVYVNNDTLREFVMKENPNSKKFSNPFSKRNIEPLILAGAFDSIEENRYKLINQFYDIRNVKADKFDELQYKTRDKLKYELELLGYYVSQHPLDNSSFPYVNLDNMSEGSNVKIAGIFLSYKVAHDKKGKKYYKATFEFKDGSTRTVHIRENVYKKHKDLVSLFNSQKAKDKQLIFIITGKNSKIWNNIGATNIQRVISNAELQEEKEENRKVLLQTPEDVPKIGGKSMEDLGIEMLGGL